MAEVVIAGLLTSAIVKIASDKLSSALGEQANLAWNFTDDLEYMKDKMESMEAVFEDAEKQSVKDKSVRLWLKRLKGAALDISDMMDDYQESTPKMPGTFSCCTYTRKKIVLANKMKNMRKKLERINKERQNFTFTPRTAASQDQQRYDERETTSAVNEAKILGRDGEKKKIIDILSASHRKDGTMVLPIYGLGGIGKSTLAQLVYNDTQFNQYEHRVWVYVSEVFDLKKIGNSIISHLSTDGGQHNLNTMQMISQHLNKLLPDKKILIVLDDIWQEEALELDKLKDMLHVDKKGSMVDVLVTTRSESIANKICTKEPYKLQPLTDNVCWDIIKRYSGFEDKCNKEKLEETGFDIAKKCGGVALAAQALGYMLKSKDLHGWSEINNSDIWNESFGGDDSQHKKVLPSLKLSYERMLPILRLCFSYCAIFPKGHDIYEDDLVHQWLALDFVKKPSEGKEYIKQLLGMSFLQNSKLSSIYEEHVTRYTMHDLVHDLARSVIGDELIVIADASKSKTSEQKYCRYALLTNYNGQTKLSNILPKKVRALHFSSSSKLGPHDGSFSFAKRLRILDFSECSGILLQSSIGQLKQLKCLIAPKVQNNSLPEAVAEFSKLQYLNLRGSQISALPESVGKLSCLIYLGLSECSDILKVPEPVGELRSLMHLDMSYCSGIAGLPCSLGNLTKLQHLDLSCSGVKEIPESLGGLNQLQYLNLSRLSGVKEIPESLGGLNQLQYLNLSYCIRVTSLPQDIGKLINLQYLDLKCNGDIKELPGSFQNLQNLVHLDLSMCGDVKGLPEALCGLTSLRHLNIAYVNIDYSSWKHLSDAMGNLTNLKYLNISHTKCYPDFISTLTNLEHLVLSWNKGFVSLPECIGNLKKLHTLDLSHCERLEYLPDSIGNLKKLHTLDLSYCKKLESLPDSISEITELKSLLIEGCSDELIDEVNSKLHYSVALPIFKVRADGINTCSNLPLLEGTNVDELIINSLENVWSVEEARNIKLLDKTNLSKLTLSWTHLTPDRFLDVEDLLGQLEPPRGLKLLCLKGYSGQSFPCWFMDISHHLPNIVSITLNTLPKCSNLPPLGQLLNLESLYLENCPRVTKVDKDLCGGKGAFRRLSNFYLGSMDGLEEWCTKYSVEDGVEEFMFPMLDKLVISKCPMLRLKPCAPTFCEFKIESSDQVISSLEEVGKGNNTGHLMSSSPGTSLTICRSNSKGLRLFHHFPALQDLEISYCDDLTSLPESMRHLASLEWLDLCHCEGISAVPEWLGDLSSLERLTIRFCQGIKSLPPCIQQIKKLQMLWIDHNPELKQWCEIEENRKKLAHIKKIPISHGQQLPAPWSLARPASPLRRPHRPPTSLKPLAVPTRSSPTPPPTITRSHG